MKKPRPMIKFNGGKPVALCNRCFVIMCYVSCTEDDGENCAVIEVNGDGKEDYITTPIGQVPPPYCDKCNKLLTYSINE
jgi:hypothetical protein